KCLPKIKLNHLFRLTDNFGIVRFAKLTRRDASSGYTLDDNAQALAAAALYYAKFGAPSKRLLTVTQKNRLLGLINTYLDFIAFVTMPDYSFQNFVSADKALDESLNEQNNSENASAFALYALTLTSTTGSLPAAVRQKAFTLLRNSIAKSAYFDSPRAIAVYVKALHVLRDKKVEITGIDLERTLQNQCDKLVHLYQETVSPEWRWFESYLAYSNGVLPEALLLGYRVTGDERYLAVGKTTLDFLIEESFVDDVYKAIGQDSQPHKNDKRRYYDQQPEEVQSMVSALGACYSVTGDENYSRLMHRVFYWFLGDNSVNQVIYDRATGGCYDGVGKRTINLNQGARATIAYLLARLAFE
ncbi:MAG: hypothetical protein JSW30_03225, partial [Dehalococcoidia bacterium]